MSVIKVWAICLALAATMLMATASGQEPSIDVPVLTADQAVAIAVQNNRTLKISSLGVDAAHEQWLAAKTKRFPAFSSYILASDLLTDISFTIKEGQLGTYANVGPIPDTDKKITTSSNSPSAYVIAKASQPLLTLHKVNLSIRGQGLAVEQASEQVRGGRQSLTASVGQAYYSIMQAESAIEAAQASIEQYKELDRITAKYVEEQTALKSDNLQVKAKLAQEQYTLVQLQDKLQDGKENLNDLLGRDINTPFRTSQVADLSPDEEDLQAAQAKVVLQHPQIKEAGLTVKQAQIQESLAKAQYLPDINATFQYISPFGVDFLPTNIATVGIEFSWEPYDWGRRKHTLQQDTITVRQSQQQLDETRSQLLINLNAQFRTLHEARMAVSVANANRDAAQEKSREVLLQYKQKSVLLSDVLKQQAATEAAESDYNQAMTSFWIAKANYQKALGEE